MWQRHLHQLAGHAGEVLKRRPVHPDCLGSLKEALLCAGQRFDLWRVVLMIV
jgi:hypothetical protein